MQEPNPAASACTGFWLLIGLLAVFAASKPILFDTLDPDCFWHLRVAEQLHRDGIGPIVDDLSFASNRQAWTPYSWLAELGMKSIWDHGGYRSAIAVTAIVQGFIVFLLAACCIQIQGAKPQYFASVIATVIGTFITLPYLSFRPVTAGFSILFTIVWLILRGRPAVWFIVPLTILLTNIHLFSFFVPAICLAMAVGAIIERNAKSAAHYSMLSTATLLACLATPMLPGLIKTIFFYSAQDQMVTGPVIAEMQSFARGPFGWIAAIGVVGMLSCIAARYRLVGIGPCICVGVATLLLLRLGRFAPLFAVAACPAFAATLPGLKDRLLGKPAVAVVLVCVLGLEFFQLVKAFPSRAVALSSWVNRHGPDTPGYPCAAADFIDCSVTSSTGHLINEFSWGGYLAWRLNGKYQVLLDGRTQVFPQSLWQATYLGTEPDRAQYLSKVNADVALLPIGTSKFRQALIRLGWTPTFADDRAQVLLAPSHFTKLD